MSRRLAWGLLAVAALGAVWVGSEMRPKPPGGDPPTSRPVLYWVDPMNPAIRVSGPGIAPCGMPYEPVYAENSPVASAAPSGADLVSVPGAVRQLTGVRVEAASVRAVTFRRRLLGRVAPDESRIYRVYSVTEGWIRELSPAVTGSFVKRDEKLATFASLEVAGPQLAYISALEALDRAQQNKSATEEQIELNRKNLRVTKQQLINLGVSETQATAIEATRKPSPTIEIRSPASGFILARNVSAGQRFDRTTELYVIGDLEQVWIVAAAYGDDARDLRSGSRALIRPPGGGAPIPAVVSDVLPQFDPATRTLEVRLEASNPGFVLRPGMLVDVEAETTLPRALVVPSAAVLDSGSRTTVFVERTPGAFERRRITTGWSAGGFVEVLNGLTAGERVAVSGNFLLDSESRMRVADPGAEGSSSHDPKHD